MGYIKNYKFEKLLLLPIKLWFKPKKKLNEKRLAGKDCNFIIFYGGAIGDCVLATYFVSALKKQYPLSKITFIAIPAAVKLLECLNEIDVTMKTGLFSIRSFGNLFSLKVWKEFRKESLEISKHTKFIKGYKVLICLNRMDSLLGVYKTKLISSIIDNDYSIGLNSNNTRGAFFDTSVTDPGNLAEHLTHTWSRIISHLSKKHMEIDASFRCTVKEEILLNPAFKFQKKYCIIHTGGGSDASMNKWVNKRWAINNFYDLADWIVKEYDCDVVFIGTANEKDPSFDDFKKESYIDLYGKTTLPQLVQVLSGAAFYVGNDSGLAHISSFLNIKTVVIWGYTSYIDYAPISPNTSLIRLDLTCSPCLHIFENRICKGTDWEFKCIKGIGLEVVKDRIGMLI
jgi:ADP-heptose:LPS heptosyltransferase